VGVGVLPSLAPDAPGVIGKDGDGEVGLQMGDIALMHMLLSREIKPWRIGSLQSWNEPLAVEQVGDTVAEDNGPLGLAG